MESLSLARLHFTFPTFLFSLELFDPMVLSFSMHQNHWEDLLKHRSLEPLPEFLIQEVWGRAQNFTLITNSQVLLRLLVLGSHLENHWFNLLRMSLYSFICTYANATLISFLSTVSFMKSSLVFKPKIISPLGFCSQQPEFSQAITFPCIRANL